MNKEEKRWFEASREYGCATPDENCGGRLEWNHITQGKRLGDTWAFHLCFNHHQRQSPLKIAYHKCSKKWVEIHGTPLEFWKKHRENLGFDTPMPASKIVPRK